MKYRAKITKIHSWVESNYNINYYNIVRDAKDEYIEVNSEEEAEILEQMNKLEIEMIKLRMKWYEKFDNN